MSAAPTAIGMAPRRQRTAAAGEDRVPSSWAEPNAPVELGDGWAHAWLLGPSASRAPTAANVARVLALCRVGGADLPLSYERSAQGIPGAPGETTLSVSHSGELTLVCVGRARAVGVDVERIRDLDVVAFARLYFGAGEAACLETMDDSQRRAAFFAAWTRKEAYAKATGLGLVRSDALKVDLTPRDRSHERDSPIAFAAGGRQWTAFDLALGPGYAGAVAVEAPAGLRCWRAP